MSTTVVAVALAVLLAVIAAFFAIITTWLRRIDRDIAKLNDRYTPIKAPIRVPVSPKRTLPPIHPFISQR